MKKKTAYNLVLVEASEVLSRGFVSVFETSSDFKVNRCFTDYDLFVDQLGRLHADAVLINPQLVSLNKPFHIKQLLKDLPDCVFLAIQYGLVPLDTLTNFDGVIDIFEKPTSILAKIKTAIETVAQWQDLTQNENVDLSDREKEILIAVAKGLTNKEIADKFNISFHTVITHRKNISRKTGIKTISGLTVYAMLNNLV